MNTRNRFLSAREKLKFHVLKQRQVVNVNCGESRFPCRLSIHVTVEIKRRVVMFMTWSTVVHEVG